MCVWGALASEDGLGLLSQRLVMRCLGWMVGVSIVGLISCRSEGLWCCEVAV
jgi:hypothetical protein